MTDEIWKNIIDYENYSVSNLGNVRNDLTGKILKAGINRDGYLRGGIFKNGIRKDFQYHRLVALAFIENSDNKKQVDHIDCNKLNNNVSNLRWATVSENSGNRKIPTTNSTGVKGVYFRKSDKKWYSQIKIDGKSYHLGLFDTLEEATAVRQAKANEIFGLFVNSCEKI
jgi:hypothetical protein